MIHRFHIIGQVQDFYSSSCAVDGITLCKHVIDKASLAIGLQMSEPTETAFVQVNGFKIVHYLF